jgi:beta-glucosidase
MEAPMALPSASQSPDDQRQSLYMPRDFVWGVSTSSCQIEGAAQVDGRGPSVWDRFFQQPGRIANNDTGDVASDHYHRYAEDIALMHKIGVQAIRTRTRDAQIGCIHNVQPSRAAGETPADEAAAQLLDAYWNRAYPDPQILGRYPNELSDLIEPNIQAGDLERIQRPVDWFGLNHYSPIYAKAQSDAPLNFAWTDAPVGVPRSPIGWQIDPEAFRSTLIEVSRRYRLPNYVTENGAGGNDRPNAAGEIPDHEHIDYFKAYRFALREAVAAGADVSGYFIWSLLDNFEWGAGYANRFGIVLVDYATPKRIPKESAHWYARLIHNEAMRAIA